MEVQYFNLEDGSVEINNDKFKFDDDVRLNRNSGYIVSILCLITSVGYILRYSKEHDSDLLWFGILTILLSLFFGFKEIFSKITTQSEVALSNISEVNLKTSSKGKITGKIILMNKKVRPFLLENEDGQEAEFINLLRNRDVLVTGN